MTRPFYAISVLLLAGLFGLSLPTQAAADQSMLFDHNGSRVRLDVRQGSATIRYAEPRPGLSAAGIGPGTVLFEGRMGSDGAMQGTAYTYAVGCAPAPYAASGALRGGGLLLRGAAPQRQRGGCAIIGYDPQSPHALLAFNSVAAMPLPANATAPAAVAAQAASSSSMPVTPPSSLPPGPPVRPDPLISDYDRLLDGYLASREG
ncbi:hypothetical protein [Bradyrhizobium sp. WSM1253]|uniref:hypothetical protein n=1 Tax=Bradyrhizobium sp. WSM1253 TaxID=319003 RepID=UPI00025D27C6|nr:hypothetical protein [Bradyrhizobium sp. WSM1253]EIG61250.1 hypothetical protein Bra1253DRAFT_06075 [Bradyrhizobium sp. WSM1253]